MARYHGIFSGQHEGSTRDSAGSVSKVKTPRLLVAAGFVWAAAVVLSGCALVQGPADRTDEFTAAGQECTGSWWLGDLREGTSAEAREAAEEALAEAEVTRDRLESATSLLGLSKNEAERASATAVDFESEAYMLAVTLHVKDALEGAGYPDIDRVMEIWSERRCS